MLKDRFCPVPFTNFRVSASGDVSVCSPERMKIPVVGNLIKSSAPEVWNSEATQSIRRGILDGSFSQCKGAYCPALQKNSLPNRNGITDPDLRRIIDQNLVVMDKSPSVLNMHVDKTCNLKCPNCRTDIIGIKGKELERATIVRDKIVDGGMLRDAKSIILCGYGEVFASTIHLGFLRGLDPSNHPQLRIKFLTNGLLLTEKMWSSFANAHPLVDEIAISVDAATAGTFRLNRGGDFDRLVANLEFVSSLRKAKAIEMFRLNFVVQKNNFREMPDFVALGRRLGCDRVIFQKLVNSSGAHMTDYADRAIHLPEHPEHEAFLETLRSPELKQKIVELYSIGGVAKMANAEPALAATAQPGFKDRPSVFASLSRSLLGGFGRRAAVDREVDATARTLLTEHGALAYGQACGRAKPKLRGDAPDPFWTKVAERIAQMDGTKTGRPNAQPAASPR